MNRKLQLGLAAASISTLIIACGPPRDRAKDIRAANPTGHINNLPWTMSSSRVTRSGSGDAGTLDVELFADQAGPCGQVASQADYPSGFIQFPLPAAVGRRPLQLSFNLFDPSNQVVTFTSPSPDGGLPNNDLAVDGIINVTEISETSVTFGLLANGSAGDDVNGTVTTTFCH